MKPDLRLAQPTGNPGENVLAGKRGVRRLEQNQAPAVLIAFPYLTSFLRLRQQIAIRDWALDSGAFTAHYSGKPIELSRYIDTCQKLRAADPKLAEVFALDVIGDWRASRRNAEKMMEAGVPVVPAFHHGSPWAELVSLAKAFPKIALGGVARMRQAKKLAWAEQCFARVWPARIHGFGFGTRQALMRLPFHSTDASSWEMGACVFGTWQSLGKLRLRGSSQNLRAEVEHYLRIEREARSRWANEMKLLEGLR